MGAAVYILCTLTSALCAVLLLRRHWREPNRLLWWSGVSFCAMAVANALGVRVRSLPITPDKVLAALGALA